MLPVVLDFDHSVLTVAEDELRFDLSSMQEAVRFGCTARTFSELSQKVNALLSADVGCVFTGSGDFHHLSAILLKRLCGAEPLTVVVFDNHPDNMRYPFGIHCGSWVRSACSMPNVEHVHVSGMTSEDVTARHSFETYLTPFLRGRLTYRTIGVQASWLRIFGADSAHSFVSADDMVDDLLSVVKNAKRVYLSIDKDVLSETCVATNWDQGVCLPKHIERVIDECSGKLVGVDITGDVSEYVYKSRFKRILSGLDGQKPVDPQCLVAMQKAQQVLNMRLLARLNAAMCSQN